MASVFIFRPRQYADLLRRYVILVDEEPVATICAGQTIELKLVPGHHRISATIDWASGNPVEIVAKSNGVYHLEVGNNLGGGRLLLAACYLTIWRDQWLYLRMADDSLSAPPELNGERKATPRHSWGGVWDEELGH
jgi:hypothetical protein